MTKSIDNIEKISKFEYLVMFFAICISGNPLFIYTESKMLYVVSAALMFGICLFKGRKLLNSKFKFWIVCSIILFLFQNTILEITSINAEINFLLRLYIAFMTASFFGHKFREVYFKVIVFVCLISLPFFILQASGITFGYRFGRYNTIAIFNSVLPTSFSTGARNSGMFWEPGAFQGFIMLVPLLYCDKLKQLWKMHKKECIILLIALLTTKSTTGYITFAAFLFLMILLNGKINIFVKGVLITAIIGAFSYMWSQDFMGEKIEAEYKEMQSIQKGDVSWNRMGAMMIDIENISRHPVIGNGFMDASRYGILGEYMRGVGNGFTGAINMFGIPFILLYFISLFGNLSHIPKASRLVFIFAIILILNGEYMLNYPFFWSLLFIKIPQYGRIINTFNGTQSKRENITVS